MQNQLCYLYGLICDFREEPFEVIEDGFQVICNPNKVIGLFCHGFSDASEKSMSPWHTNQCVMQNAREFLEFFEGDPPFFLYAFECGLNFLHLFGR